MHEFSRMPYDISLTSFVAVLNVNTSPVETAMHTISKSGTCCKPNISAPSSNNPESTMDTTGSTLL